MALGVVVLLLYTALFSGKVFVVSCTSVCALLLAFTGQGGGEPKKCSPYQCLAPYLGTLTQMNSSWLVDSWYQRKGSCVLQHSQQGVPPCGHLAYPANCRQ